MRFWIITFRQLDDSSGTLASVDFISFESPSRPGSVQHCLYSRHLAWFPDEWRLPYTLACCCAKLGELKPALKWLERAIDAADKLDIRLKALEEKDLEPLWVDIAEI